MIIRIGYYTKDEPKTVNSGSFDSQDRETHAHLQKLLGDANVDRVWARKGAYGYLYLKGEPQRDGKGISDRV